MQELEENLRETQATAQRFETHLKQKEKLYEEKIKVMCQHTYEEPLVQCKTTTNYRKCSVLFLVVML